MTDNLQDQIRNALWECAQQRMSLDDFRVWFVPLSCNIEGSGEPEAVELAHQIDGILAEASSAGWSDAEISEELARPFVLSPLAENVFGDPLSFPVSQASVPNTTIRGMSAARTPDYSFVFDKAKDTWVCSVHGEVDSPGWVPCWNGCDEGYFDDYEEDPIECEPGEISTCQECKGKGRWRVCGECNADNPDVEW